jgi:rod shape-determining protein MreC
MAIGTIDRTPPPFFRQGPSALTKLTFCSALALLLMVADTRFRITQPLRAVAAAALYPVQRTLLVPVDVIGNAADYLVGLHVALSREEAARIELARQAERAMRAEQLLEENKRLRALLELRPTLQVRSQAAQILYEASDPYSRKVVIDRGSSSGIVLASSVVNEAGVLGQVTRVYLSASEVTLVTDKDAAIPVLNSRTQARSAAYGGATALGGAMELRFMANNADVQVGDVLTTSGVDGVYPPGLPVARVEAVDRKIDTGFARILLAPLARADGVRHVLVLDPIGLQMPTRPDAAVEAAPKPAATKKGPRSDGAAEAASKPAVTKKAVRPETATEASDQPVAAQPVGAQPVPAQPVAAQPAAAKPATAKPEVTKPAAAKPEVTKPAAAKPPATKPAATKPVTAQSAAAKAATAQPTTARSRAEAAAESSSKPATAKKGAPR